MAVNVTATTSKLAIAALICALTATAARATLSPDDPTLSGNLQMWLKASAGVESASGVPAGDGDAVLNWLDQSANARIASQSTASARPTYHAGAGSAPYLSFGDAEDYLYSLNMPAITDGFTFSVLFRPADPQLNASPTLMAYQDTSWGLLFEQLASQDKITVYNQDSWGWNALSSHDLTLGQWQLFTASWSKATGELNYYNNGQLSASYTGMTTAITTVGPTSTLTIAARHSGSETGVLQTFLTGDIAELVIYDRGLTGSEVDGIEADILARQVPEPATLALLGVGGIALAVRRRR